MHTWSNTSLNNDMHNLTSSFISQQLIVALPKAHCVFMLGQFASAPLHHLHRPDDAGCLGPIPKWEGTILKDMDRYGTFDHENQREVYERFSKPREGLCSPWTLAFEHSQSAVRSFQWLYTSHRYRSRFKNPYVRCPSILLSIQINWPIIHHYHFFLVEY